MAPRERLQVQGGRVRTKTQEVLRVLKDLRDSQNLQDPGSSQRTEGSAAPLELEPSGPRAEGSAEPSEPWTHIFSHAMSPVLDLHHWKLVRYTVSNHPMGHL